MRIYLTRNLVKRGPYPYASGLGEHWDKPKDTTSIAVNVNYFVVINAKIGCWTSFSLFLLPSSSLFFFHSSFFFLYPRVDFTSSTKQRTVQFRKTFPFRSIPPYPPHPLHSPSFPSISSFPLSLSTTPFCPYHFSQSFLICTVMFNEPMCSVPVLLNQRLSPSLLSFASFLPGTASLTPTLNPLPTTLTRPINRRSALRALEQDRNAEWGWTF